MGDVGRGMEDYTKRAEIVASQVNKLKTQLQDLIAKLDAVNEWNDHLSEVVRHVRFLEILEGDLRNTIQEMGDGDGNGNGRTGMEDYSKQVDIVASQVNKLKNLTSELDTVNEWNEHLLEVIQHVQFLDRVDGEKLVNKHVQSNKVEAAKCRYFARKSKKYTTKATRDCEIDELEEEILKLQAQLDQAHSIYDRLVLICRSG